MTYRILRTPADLLDEDIRSLYSNFSSPITTLDCGQKCAPHNPNGIPFCCDICDAVPAAYQSEWEFMKSTTGLWHRYRRDECGTPPDASEQFANSPKYYGKNDEIEMPPGMIPLACLGPKNCERENRLLSCRQFPFYPYITSDYCFLGLAYDWEFESKCWLISRLGLVTDGYREEFVRTYDRLFALFQDELESYAVRSEETRTRYASIHRSIPIIYHDGGFRLVSPVNERVYRVTADKLPRFSPYR